MKGIAVAAAAGLLIAGLVGPGSTRAQQTEPEKAPKLTLKSVEAQVVTLQTELATLHPDDFAVVSGTGDLNRGSSSAVSASNVVTGGYEVTFNKDVSACAYIATIGDVGTNQPNPGQIAVYSVADDADSVGVKTYDSTGTAANSPFHLSLSCP
jgi:hypothetical protein